MPHLTHSGYIEHLLNRVVVGEEEFRLASGAMSKVKVELEDLCMRGDTTSEIRDYLIGFVSFLRNGTLGSIGGPGFGANPPAAAVAGRLGIGWFSRDKDGIWRNKPERGDRVAIVDDVVTSGGSILRLIDPLLEAGVEIVGVTAFLDRAGVAEAALQSRGVPFEPLAKWSDLGLERVTIAAPATVQISV